MTAKEIKSEIQKSLDRVPESVLHDILDFLKKTESQGNNAEVGQIWKTLTEEQKKEVYASYEESADDKNLTNWEDIKKKY